MHLSSSSFVPTGGEVVTIVDNCSADRRKASQLCVSAGWKCQAFASSADFLAQVSSSACGCLVVELAMPETTMPQAVLPQISGIELFQEIRRRGYALTTIIWTRHADAGSCRAAFRAGAFDFVDKDLPADELTEILRRGLETNRTQIVDLQTRRARWEYLRQLSKRELQVAKLLAKGWVLKEIGHDLNITVQTASKHRARIFSKLGVANGVQLHQVVQELESPKIDGKSLRFDQEMQ